MNEKELAEMLARARKLNYDESTLDFLTGYIESHLIQADPLFNASVFHFDSGYKERVEL